MTGHAVTRSDAEICTTAGMDPSTHHGAVAPPIYQTSLFAQPSMAVFAEHQASEHEDFVYSRGANPTVAVLAGALAELERGEAAQCFGSGMGAISAVWSTLLSAGDHVLLLNDVYGPTLQLAQHLERLGVEHTLVRSPGEDWERHLRPSTRLIHLESPGTYRMKILDLRAIADVARTRGITTVIDGTWATPLFQKPLEHGIDVVVHSLTKYVGGHSDVLGGAVIGSAAFVRELFYAGFQLQGSVMSALEASLVLRGLRTLPVRMAEHQRNAVRVVDYLRTRPEVAAVHHPHADLPADHRLRREQLTGVTGLLSLDLTEATPQAVARFVDALRLFRIGPSWGGYESLVTSPSKPGGEAAMAAQSFSAGMVRLSVGLEGADAQIADLAQALDSLAR
ncbi:PLP-dependent aspartate aminotransferase family protein [uncultured Pseudokineococcus sp.]|uniref:trans-sulfuration enzyme family protein n=1 Tax=uncultured Pseudokineococcus sp. TaxID=1642928 RepID=UPI0026103165|nr:PLP-dependent aspartate aminotransferase family protein [uncultured Pseudokineococcus sp.]